MCLGTAMLVPKREVKQAQNWAYVDLAWQKYCALPPLCLGESNWPKEERETRQLMVKSTRIDPCCRLEELSG